MLVVDKLPIICFSTTHKFSKSPINLTTEGSFHPSWYCKIIVSAEALSVLIVASAGNHALLYACLLVQLLHVRPYIWQKTILHLFEHFKQKCRTMILLAASDYVCNEKSCFYKFCPLKLQISVLIPFSSHLMHSKLRDYCRKLRHLHILHASSMEIDIFLR